ncbi:MAG: chemotaxis protein CheA [Dissulfurispiraceae bacterium]|jgi:two-component system chemotaxis sensor kinase CheA|nr:chemotaxis protein CheA [Dissulfurispiraceae bacterium]
MSMTDRHKEVFREEASELLVELENSLLELEERPDDEELISRVFRAMHTIKGSGAMFGFDQIVTFTHEIETVFDQVRNGRLSVTKELIDLTLESRDQIRQMLDAAEGESAGDPGKRQKLVSAYKRLLPDSVRPESEEGQAKTKDKEVSEHLTYRIYFRPDQDIIMRGINPLMFLPELADMGECTFIANTCSIPLLSDIDPAKCYVSWNIILTTNLGVDAIKDVFIFVEDECELKIDVIDRCDPADDTRIKMVGEILAERGDISHEALQKVLSKQKRIGELLVDEGLVSPDQIQSALTEQKHIKSIRDKRQKVEVDTSIRVASEKLDMLVNLVGELVTVQARLTQTASSNSDPELLLISEEVERLSAELRDNTMSIRMLPIGSTFSKFKRLVRDLSGELHKEMELTTEGAETELDKTVIDKLGDPMVHLIRNSIDHGIESPDERLAKGKPAKGNLHLSARHSGANVLIEIKDDGKGLDPDVIKSKAVEKGLVLHDAVMTDREIFSLILLPGFSTAKIVTNVSGRGVGMDVVKKAIDSLRGTIEIDSEKNIGTTITLRLPLTLAIIDGLLVNIAQESFVLPLSSVQECIELTDQDRADAHGKNTVAVRGELVPYISLRDQFGMTGQKPAIEQVVITEVNGMRVGFVVDHVIGEHQTVLKNLGRFYRDAEGISGATILGNGSVALILDMQKLVESVEKREVAR